MHHLIHIASGADVKIGHAIFDRRDGAKHIITRLPDVRQHYVGYSNAEGNYAEIHFKDCGVSLKHPHRTGLCDGDEVRYAGLRFKVKFPHDDDATEPWNRGDGYGIVTEWTRRDKKPGEIIISSDRGMYRYYDWQKSIAKAKREGWDAEPYCSGTKGEQAVRAVKSDYEFLKAWCDDEWHFVGIEITCLDDEGKEIGEDSCYGFETWKDCHEEAAWDMIESLAEQVNKERAASAAAAAALAQAQALEQRELQAIANELGFNLVDGLYASGWTAAGVEQQWAKYTKLLAKAGITLPPRYA